MNYEELTKEQLISILKEKNIFTNLREEVKNAVSQKEANGIFLRLSDYFFLKKITQQEFNQLKELIKIKIDELKTEEQKNAEEFERLSFIEQFKITNKLLEDEEWRDGLIYCKKCGGRRSFQFGDKIVRAKCDCQEKEMEQEEELKKTIAIKELNLQKLMRIGINPKNYGFEKFEIKFDWQRKMVECVKEFLKEPEKSIIITGQSGAGKTHLLNSAVIELISCGYEVEYLKWLEHGKYLKSIVMDKDLYQPLILKIKNVKVLYIDDFLKVGKNDVPSKADIDLAFEIIDYRNENCLITMISSERNLQDIIKVDEATGGRIVKLCKLRFELGDFKNVENYRLL